MKIAISSTGKGYDSKLDPRFGRASFFLIVDSDTQDIIEVIDNRAAQDAAHGAGINAASTIAQSGANVVLTGRVGPKAFSVLSAAGIKVISEMDGTVREAVKKFLAQSMTPSDGPDCNGHSFSPRPKDAFMAKGGCKGKGMGRSKGKGKCKR